MSSDAIAVLVTAPDRESADVLARALVEERRIACANVLPGIRSVYRWEGRVEEGEEVLLVLKTTRARFEEVRARVVELHPYEVPEVIALPVVAGHEAYLRWIADSV
ncbi:MAG TPA: divalent-cation tolerance protein CutA [Fredinandcohnia sp.]|nr:divalent-cation tolerance protein CutA [Fredinandcohnia sp.]